MDVEILGDGAEGTADGRQEMGVFVGVGMEGGEAGILDFLGLGGEFVVEIELASVDGADEIRHVLGKGLAGVEGETTDEDEVDADVERGGGAGKLNGVVYQVSVPRSERITDMGMEVPPSMGLATAINFQPTGGGKAAITGDFVMRASEVNLVIRALRDHGIIVSALHSHMLNEEPRLFFMHFWANADAVALAGGLRAALDLTNVRRPVAR